MKNTKLIRHHGWAWGEKEDMAMLEAQAREGWHLKSMPKRYWYYRLEKGEPAEVSYSLDCFRGDKNEYDDYVEMFKEAGWQPVLKYGNGKAGTYTIFKAPAGTVPIYTDQSTKAEHYRYQHLAMLKFGAIVLGLGIALLLMLSYLRTFEIPFILDTALGGFGGGFLGVGSLCLMGSLAYQFQAKGKGIEIFHSKIAWTIFTLLLMVTTFAFARTILR